MLLNETSESARAIETLRARISTLSTAILRISASLEVDTVLQEIAEPPAR